MTYQELKAEENKYVMNTYGRFPVAIDHGEGATLYDPEGNAYVDFAIEVGKELELFTDEQDLQETIDFWKLHKRM